MNYRIGMLLHFKGELIRITSISPFKYIFMIRMIPPKKIWVKGQCSLESFPTAYRNWEEL